MKISCNYDLITNNITYILQWDYFSQFDFYNNDFVSGNCDFISHHSDFISPNMTLNFLYTLSQELCFHIREILHDATRLCTLNIENEKCAYSWATTR